MDERPMSLENFRLLLAKIERLQSALDKISVNQTDSNEPWLDNAQVCKELRISRRQLQNYRDQGTLPYSKFGNKIYYRREDINAHLMRNYKGEL
jgi:hypothetical protein